MLSKTRFSLNENIHGLITLSSVRLIAVALFTLNDTCTGLRKQKQIELTPLSELTLQMVNEQYEAAKTSNMAQEEAQQRAAARLNTLRFGSDNYFWINDVHPRGFMHPTHPALNGKDVSGLTAVNTGAGEPGLAWSQMLATAQPLANESSHLKAELREFLDTVRAA